MIKALSLLLAAAAPCSAFTVNKPSFSVMNKSPLSRSALDALLSAELEKPLGIILEEVEENQAKGVKVEELTEDGSANASEFKDQLVGLKVATVQGTDVTNMAFDDVMDCIINAPSPVSIEFEVPDEPMFEAGATVQIKVIQEGNADKVIDGKVGENLRQTLLNNDVELYRGLKKKLGNCGGGGQCTFCAVDLGPSEGWQERSDYENKKLAKAPNARLACLNNIQGPATIRVQ
ncbi:hypothetical protein CTEN210_10416 [Chaetoceros tenuissimus]|uniref:PDZ domain-containing protein n=1 Tax=Chaetoceros tenuissimus TaxID=426638 RepID=A0AAD3CZM6_9STRA|nr:hypothetical protein CTEN210_10416 [Chaetoceros tenuissimus]